ncbi:hypothetical protein ILUMI_23811 [Ignelater luminosus]|uniref:DDE Tnp4 domain-containing protein n=1 Tax=Ignelater luminosus TaxID=2038154 RepID=A0A8K0CBF1_IGNLU|nr:hypothetical protein ILUMI_23811 [Ignelater luminosus]
MFGCNIAKWDFNVRGVEHTRNLGRPVRLVIRIKEGTTKLSRMRVINTYTDLLSLVTPDISKTDTCMRRAITLHEQLTATLGFLATGRSYRDLEFTTAVSKQSLSCIFPLPMLPASLFIVMQEQMAEFLMEELLQIPCFMRCLQIPKARTVSNSDKRLPYDFVGDEAFDMLYDLLKPARRVVENTFGIMASRFGILHTAINLNLTNIDTVVLTCCALHNFSRRECAKTTHIPEVLDHENIDDGSVEIRKRCRHGQILGNAKVVRNKFKMYINEGLNMYGKTIAYPLSESSSILLMDFRGVSWSLENDSKSKYHKDGLYTSSAEVPHRIDFLILDNSLRYTDLKE